MVAARPINETRDSVWQRWMVASAEVHRRYFDAMDEGGDAFAFNERASVSVLVAGAERASMITLAEFMTAKGGSSSCKHRSDLYLYDPSSDQDWGIEFKQAWRGVDDAYAKLEVAKSDAMQLGDDCGEPCFGVVISLWDKPHEKRRAILDAFHTDLKRSDLFFFEFGDNYDPGCAAIILGQCSY